MKIGDKIQLTCTVTEVIGSAIRVMLPSGERILVNAKDTLPAVVNISDESIDKIAWRCCGHTKERANE